MKEIDLANWNRKEHFEFFSAMNEPFFGLVQNLDATIAYKHCKTNGIAFFAYYLHCALQAINAVENLRYRIVDGKPVVFDSIDASTTIMRDDKTFGFSFIKYDSNFTTFKQIVVDEVARVQQTPGLFTRNDFKENLIHFSAIPWVNFTSLSHARSFTHPDSCPKVSIGKLVENNGRYEFAVAVHAHHGLADGYHLGLFFEEFQKMLDK
ncbi:chloramphenicol acetyltransferase [Flavobacterium agricola]|uniref:Chloramphenicol acetyltransferase n=1 Tax=Flavobacterium agricola TaxID=2870839 RepID=A0ABY6M0A5_9FLAO|nr:chloramphenicol acetyltransferase [Flavobacterium agricola]UYW01104.1 chloramphenicol acetyltransferase [Flavobacterium agricola]